MPVGSGTDFVGSVDLVTMTAVLYQAGADGLSKMRASSRLDAVCKGSLWGRDGKRLVEKPRKADGW